MFRITLWSAILLSSLCLGAPRTQKENTREEGTYAIYLNGKNLGSEKYSIVTTPASVQSNSVLDFRNPLDMRQRVQISTRLEMDGQFVPQHYELKSVVDGKSGAILGQFSPNEAIFAYTGAGAARKQGVLVGKDFTALDTNVFHHFIFLARLFDQRGRNEGRFEVVIPQVPDSGMLKIEELAKERVALRGKMTEARHLKVDSGSLIIDLWVDASGLVRKITVPSKGIEVVRDP